MRVTLPGFTRMGLETTSLAIERLEKSSSSLLFCDRRPRSGRTACPNLNAMNGHEEAGTCMVTDGFKDRRAF